MAKRKLKPRPKAKPKPKAKRAKPARAPKGPRDRTAEIVKQREQRAQARDIGAIPAVKDPKRRAACERNLLRFLRTYQAPRFPLPFSDDHLKSIGRIEHVVFEGGLMSKAAPRGDGKTTRFEGAALWAALYGHRQFIMLIGADQGAADELLMSLRSELENNELLAEDFPEAVFPIRALDGIARRAEGQTAAGVRTLLVWNDEEVRLPTTAARGGCILRTTGITGSVRGAKGSLADGTIVRPDLVLLDDPQTRESARSASQVANLLATIRADVLGLAGPGKAIACFAAVTVIASNDVADQLTDRKLHPEWQGDRTKLMRSLPSKAAMELWDEYAEIYADDLRAEIKPSKARATEFYREHQVEMDDGAEPTWPARMEIDEISAIQHAMTLRMTRGPEAFNAEYQNEPADLSTLTGSTQLEAQKIAQRVNHHAYGIVPRAASIVTGFIDVQLNALFWTLVGWEPGFAGDVIAYGAWPKQSTPYFTARTAELTIARAYPNQSFEAALYAALTDCTNQLFGTEWRRDGDDGGHAFADLVLIDANWGDSTDTVYKFARRSGHGSRIMPSHGRGIKAIEKPMAQWGKGPGDRAGLNWRIKASTGREVRHVMYDTNFWKSFTATRLLAGVGDPASVRLYGEAGTDHRMFADHCAAEMRTKVTARERTVDEWQARSVGIDNHWFDGLVGSAVAASIRGVVLNERSALTNLTTGPVRPSRHRRVGYVGTIGA
jgi:hypothetical protein